MSRKEIERRLSEAQAAGQVGRVQVLQSALRYYDAVEHLIHCEA